MIDLSKSIEELSIENTQDFDKAIKIVGLKTYQHIENGDPETNLEFRKIQKLIEEINRFEIKKDYEQIMIRNSNKVKKFVPGNLYQ